MARVKFLVFALIVLALGVAHLPLTASGLGEEARRAAVASAQGALGGVRGTLAARRSGVQGVALQLAATGELAALAQSVRAGEPVPGERLVALRAAVQQGLAPELKDSLVLGVGSGTAVTWVRGVAAPSSDATKLDMAALGPAGGAGAVKAAFGAPHVFVSVPVRTSGDGILTLVVGAPALPDGALDRVLAASGAGAVALLQDGAVVAQAGPLAKELPAALKALGPGKTDVVQRGALVNLGPVKLPMGATASDTLGGAAPLRMGARGTTEDGALELLALASTETVMRALSDYQQTALAALFALALLTALWAAIVIGPEGVATPAGTRPSDTLGGAMVRGHSGVFQAPRAGASGAFASPSGVHRTTQSGVFAAGGSGALRAPAGSGAFAAPKAGASGAFAAPAAAPAPADDFPFGAPAPQSAEQQQHAAQAEAAFAYAPAGQAAIPAWDAAPPAAQSGAYGQAQSGAYADPYGQAAYGGASHQAAQSGAYGQAAYGGGASGSGAYAQPPAAQGYEYEDQPTTAYTLQQAADPYALAGAQTAPPVAPSPYEDNPEATRVASIPQELLQQAAAAPMQAAGAVALSHQQLAPPPVQAWGTQAASSGTGPMGAVDAAGAEEQHFQQVFRDFVTTRERCGELADGLTYDRFVQKLRKNREQLVAKYACRTVRFQVYVKEGKAALKATPVKD